MEDEIEKKMCRKCGQTKPLNEYYKNSKLKDGKFTTCIECIKFYNVKYHKETYKSNGRPPGRIPKSKSI